MYRHELAQPAFRAFEKTHLKLPEQRFLTLADYADLRTRTLAGGRSCWCISSR
ncbi:hypothetical protein [Pseudomonas monsensis]